MDHQEVKDRILFLFKQIEEKKEDRQFCSRALAEIRERREQLLRVRPPAPPDK